MKPTDSTRPSVIVAGAGIGGIATALSLAQLGLRVTVLEQADELGEIGPDAAAAVPELDVAVKDPNRSVSNAAREALKKIGK